MRKEYCVYVCVCVCVYIYMTLVSDNIRESHYICFIIPELTYVVEMAEWLDAMSSVKLGRFQPQLKVFCV